MIKLGVNSVLFRDHDFTTAVKLIAECGYDGVEISAIAGMCEHLDLAAWRTQASHLRQVVADAGLEFMSMEAASLDEERLQRAFEAAAEIGIPVVNVGPGGKSDVEADLQAAIDTLSRLADRAAAHGVTLCVKAHVNASVYNTPTTLRVMEAIRSPGFGIDMDPSHVFRAGENPAEALPAVIGRVRHVHIRDCPPQTGTGGGPGTARDQACGRGAIDLAAYCRAMVEGGYEGPVCLEVIGAQGLDLPVRAIIAAESYGYLNALLRGAGAR